jgi:hypothetical protein
MDHPGKRPRLRLSRLYVSTKERLTSRAIIAWRKDALHAMGKDLPLIGKVVGLTWRAARKEQKPQRLKSLI